LIKTISMHRKKGSKNLFHSCGSFRVAHNDLQLPEGGDFGTQILI